MKLLSSPLTLTGALLLLMHLNSFGQKLPSEQKEGVYAPANIKIDGKPIEWTGKFQAKNSATLLTYVMANDEQNLYLTIQADQTPALGKIFYDGISLVIKSRKDKKLKPVKMTYPLVSITERSNIVIPLRDKNKNTDSVVAMVNDQLSRSAKKILVDGIADITDPDVSVYNEVGLKAAVMVDNTRTMTFEYLLPLKYIQHLMDENGSFDYSIVVNGAKLNPGDMVVAGSSVSGGGGGGGATFSSGGGSLGAMTISVSAVGGDIFSPTDLKATYTLAKK
ncbi:hypothetical protein HQ865_18545 [Mucilaginibacter mali]|uniref:Uncharacterized protein n=1 Tax=Mucilaginibacter mali TaxID=2740462 RepID=A0A7D4UCE4_9SPHI|nr:hypothetical protein [Mucilaginibacter mali]QKJ31678.1 hypothetical protein HQ865_18545 [Mucilaginibacter mali]